MNIYKNGRISLHRYVRYLDELRVNFPRTVREIEKLQGGVLNNSMGNAHRMSQGLKIKDVSLLHRRQMSK